MHTRTHKEEAATVPTAYSPPTTSASASPTSAGGWGASGTRLIMIATKNSLCMLKICREPGVPMLRGKDHLNWPEIGVPAPGRRGWRAAEEAQCAAMVADFPANASVSSQKSLLLLFAH